MAGLNGSKPVPDLDNLRAFLAVAEAGGFRRASRQSGIRQSVLSRRISSLEDLLGASLFERTREGVRLTYAGVNFLRDVRMIFAQLEAAVRRVRSAGSATEGCVRIGTVVSMSSGFLSELLRNWRIEHADVVIEIEAALPKENLAHIVTRQIDLAIVTGAPSSAHYESETLWMENVFAALPSDHPLAQGGVITLEELQSFRFLVMRYPPGPETYDWIIARLSGLGSSPLVEEQAVGRDTLLSMVGLGFGVTLASSAETAIKYPNVSFVQVVGEQLPFSLVWSPANDNPALRRFLSDARTLSRRWLAAPSQTPGPLP